MISDRLACLVCSSYPPRLTYDTGLFQVPNRTFHIKLVTCKSLLNRPCRRERVLSISNCRKPPLSSRDRSRPTAPQSTPPSSYQGRCSDMRDNLYRATSGEQLCSRIKHHHHFQEIIHSMVMRLKPPRFTSPPFPCAADEFLETT